MLDVTAVCDERETPLASSEATEEVAVPTMPAPPVTRAVNVFAPAKVCDPVETVPRLLASAFGRLSSKLLVFRANAIAAAEVVMVGVRYTFAVPLLLNTLTSPPTDVNPVPPFAMLKVPAKSVMVILAGTTSTVAALSTAPVPPEIDTLEDAAVRFAPVTLDAGMVGMSAATSVRKVGAAAPPLLGPEKTVLAVWLSSVMASVPEVVTGLPAMSKIDVGAESATLVTVPVPAASSVARSLTGRL